MEVAIKGSALTELLSALAEGISLESGKDLFTNTGLFAELSSLSIIGLRASTPSWFLARGCSVSCHMSLSTQLLTLYKLSWHDALIHSPMQLILEVTCHPSAMFYRLEATYMSHPHSRAGNYTRV